MQDPTSVVSTLSAKDILGLSVIGAAVTTFGTLAGLVLKERVFARSFEKWKTRQALEATHSKYRDPIVLSALELCNRLREICDDYPTDFLHSQLLSQVVAPPTGTSARDAYFARYKLESSLYRLCAFLGWLELYRQDLVFLDRGKPAKDKRAEEALRGIHAALADGHLNTSTDWQSWSDALIFREEQRAIGDLMIKTTGQQRTIIGFGEFTLLLQSSDPSVNRWIAVGKTFLLDLRSAKDFRRTRLCMLLHHIVDMVEVVEPFRLQNHHRVARDRARKWLSAQAT